MVREDSHISEQSGPSPPDIDEEFLATSDGLRLFFCDHPHPEPVGVVLMTHGLGEHSGRYGHVIHYFHEQHLAAVRYDQRGHGRSDGERGHAPRFETLIDDFTLMFDETRRRYPDLPVIVYGHSMGGNVVANWCLRRQPLAEQTAGAVLSSPWFLLAQKPSRLMVSTVHLLSRLCPWLPIPARFQARKLTRNPQAINQYEHDPLVHRRITVRMASESYRAAHWALEHAGECNIPILALHGSADAITRPEGTIRFCEAAPQAQMQLLDGLVHEPHNEPEWRSVVSRIADWILERIQIVSTSEQDQQDRSLADDAV